MEEKRNREREREIDSAFFFPCYNVNKGKENGNGGWRKKDGEENG